MLPIPLCRRATPGNSAQPTSSDNLKCEILCARANGFSHQAIKRRPEHTSVSVGSVPRNHAGLDPFLESLISRWPVLKNSLNGNISSLGHVSQEMLIPLDECILAIVWEAFDCPLSQDVIGNIGDVVILMRAAALYQAKSATVSCLLASHLLR
jgi:hypothetical protein